MWQFSYKWYVFIYDLFPLGLIQRLKSFLLLLLLCSVLCYIHIYTNFIIFCCCCSVGKIEISLRCLIDSSFSAALMRKHASTQYTQIEQHKSVHYHKSLSKLTMHLMLNRDAKTFWNTKHLLTITLWMSEWIACSLSILSHTYTLHMSAACSFFVSLWENFV